MLDKWDYVLRRLFVLKSTALKKALPCVLIDLTLSLMDKIFRRSLAPGASNLIKTISSFKKPADERVDPNKTIKKLDLKDWAIIMKAFDEWPFAPQVSVANFFKYVILMLNAGSCYNRYIL